MEKNFNIVELFVKASQQYPEKIAIVDANRVISFENLAIQVQGTVSYFKRKGIKRGDRVLVFVPMSIDLYRIVLALFYMGATAVFVDEWANTKRLNLCCEIAECKAFIGHWKAHLLRFFSREIRRIPIKLGLSFDHDNLTNIEKTSHLEPALITFTTGSTGIPKAGVRSHGFLYEQFKALEDELQASPTDIDMSVLPIVLLINLGVGSTSVIAKYKPSKPVSLRADRIIQQLHKHHVTRMVASPYFVKQVAEYTKMKQIEIPSLKDIFTGGAPVFQEEAKLYLAGFGAKNIRIVYGSTEAEPISSIHALDLVNSQTEFNLGIGLPVGIPYHQTRVKIIRILNDSLFHLTNEEFKEIQQTDGTWGEIIVAGSHVLANYYQNKEALYANKIFVDGVYWHRTGDSGYLSNNQLFLTGRCQTLIFNKNGWISTFVFENYIQSITGVTIGTILAKGENITAFVELDRDIRETRNHVVSLIRKLPFQVDEVRFGTLPRDPRHYSKIEYSKLALE